jgi:hypothetical protein
MEDYYGDTVVSEHVNGRGMSGRTPSTDTKLSGAGRRSEEATTNPSPQRRRSPRCKILFSLDGVIEEIMLLRSFASFFLYLEEREIADRHDDNACMSSRDAV